MELFEIIQNLKSKIGDTVEKRIKEFEDMGKKDDINWFHELCFCILTANTSAELGIKVQNAISPEEFVNLDQEELSRKLKNVGYRFYRTRAKYIYQNRKYALNIKKILEPMDREGKRNFLVENLMGIGKKEASHFLRNVGYKDYAIIDKHIFNLMKKYRITNEIKITEKNYFLLENELKKLADKLGMDLARLDLYLWYMETGKILK